MATKTWKIEKDLCRCCHAEGAFDNLAEPRTFLDKVEVYSDMLRECLDIDIPPVPGELCAITYTICNACIARLRDACNFKKQVQDCEQRFMTLYYKNAIQGLKPATKVKEEIEVSIERPQSDTEADNIVLKKEDEDDDDDHFLGGDDDDGMSDDDLPIKPPKQSVSTMKTRPKPKPKPKAPPVVKKLKPPPKPKKKEEPKPAKEKKGIVTKLSLEDIPSGDYRQDGSKLICNHCNRICKTIRGLRDHLIFRTQKCPHCELQFCRNSIFITHKLKIHNVDHRIKCYACDARFSSQVTLDSHLKSFHKLGQKQVCDQCDYESFSKPHLKRHMISHKKVKDFHCRFCQKAFPRMSSKRLHEKIHTNERNKVCKVCQQAFVQKASLNYHMTKYHPEVNF
ncbi:zinc finger protein 652-like isoform X21 [Maniola jurtina]|uniref:zinc finger protein 652-like isoform X21 n=1 Tax=Maniola jurtina TaxID=191418 RepID=UPI001E688D40|nr:zinc finger protein 652-like isoform X21 [Maniola jurtina]